MAHQFKNSPLSKDEAMAIHARFQRGMFAREDVERMFDSPAMNDEGVCCDSMGLASDIYDDPEIGVSQNPKLMAVFWVARKRQLAFLLMRDQDIFKSEMKQWRKQAVQGVINIIPQNFKDTEYKGRKFYGLCLQQHDPTTGELQSDPDPMSLFLFGYMISGICYYFTAKTNRDMVYEYVMKGIDPDRYADCQNN